MYPVSARPFRPVHRQVGGPDEPVEELLRLDDGVIVYDGRIGSLRRVKDDVREVAEGFECGIGIENFNDVKEGDVIEAYEVREVARQL